VRPGAAPPAAEPRGLNARLQASSGALALAGLMLLTLLIGLLLGHWATARAPQAASAPQVIRLDGAAAATPAAGTPAPGGGSRATPTAARKPAAKMPKDAVPVQQVGGAKAIEKAVKKGKPIATGGAPLPKDNKPAGGGSSFQTIG
jgi:ABC-type phosphate transport system substrate-binding protein